jgi:hypothetical protein
MIESRSLPCGVAIPQGCRTVNRQATESDHRKLRACHWGNVRASTRGNIPLPAAAGVQRLHARLTRPLPKRLPPLR